MATKKRTPQLIRGHATDRRTDGDYMSGIYVFLWGGNRWARMPGAPADPTANPKARAGKSGEAHGDFGCYLAHSSVLTVTTLYERP